MRLTIGKKMILGFGVVILLLGVIAVVGFLSNVAADQSIHRLNATTADTAVSADAMAAIFKKQATVKQYLLRPDDEVLASYDRWHEALQAALAEARSHFKSSERIAWLDQIEADVASYEEAFGRIREVVSESKRLREEVLSAKGSRAFREIQQAEQLLTDHGYGEQVAGVVPVLLDLANGRLFVNKFLATSSASYFEQASAALASAEDGFATVIQAISDPTVKPVLQAAQTDVQDYRAAFVSLHGLTLERDALVSDKLDRLGPEVVALLGQIQESLVEEGEAVTRDAEASVKTAELVIVVTSLAALVLGVTAALLMTRMIVRPIRRMLVGVARVRDGDLTPELKLDRSDELGELSTGLNIMILTMRRVIGDVQVASHEVAGAATELAATSEQVSVSMHSQTDRVTQINASVEEMNRAVMDIAQKAASASETANRAGESAKQGGQVVNQTIEGMEGISSAVSASHSSRASPRRTTPSP